MTTTSRPASRAMAAAKKPVAAADSSLLGLGTQLRFYVRSIGWAPKTIRRYKKEVLRLLAEVALGSGALSVVGGTVGVIAFLAFFTGTEVGLQGYEALSQIGTSAFTGFVSAYFNTREIAPLVAGLALAATVGCGFTAQLGAMRISEEVDALEVMGVPSLPYLVTTRMIVAIVISLIHCYYGYTASGGPAGVGVAVGRAVRASIVAINVVDFFLSLAIWGTSTTVRIAG